MSPALMDQVLGWGAREGFAWGAGAQGIAVDDFVLEEAEGALEVDGGR